MGERKRGDGRREKSERQTMERRWQEMTEEGRDRGEKKVSDIKNIINMRGIRIGG